jgi:hypothetical protein
MSEPLVVSIPHRLGRAEAVRRLKAGMSEVRGSYGHLMSMDQETWSGDHLAFRFSAFGQACDGTIDVADDHVEVRLMLPWLLAMIAHTIQPLIRRETTLMLEKK